MRAIRSLKGTKIVVKKRKQQTNQLTKEELLNNVK